MSDRVCATLGPKGSNHDLVLQGYLARESISATILLCADFEEALSACAGQSADCIMICAAHPSCGHIVGAAQYRLGLFITDVFVSESQKLAIVHRTEPARTIALHPATRSYTDLSAYTHVIEVSSTVAAGEGLRAGKWDAALTTTRFAKDGRRIAQHIPPPRDAWLVLGGEDRTSVWSLPS